MKKIILFICLTIFSTILFAQAKQEKKVAEAMESLRQAIINGDSATLDRLTDSKLSYGHSAGNIENKEVFINSLASGTSDFENMDLSNQTITVRGKTAVIRHNLSANIKNSGKPAAIKLLVLLVWVKEKKQWKLLARQAVKAPV